MYCFQSRQKRGQRAEAAFVEFFQGRPGCRVIRTGYEGGGNEAFNDALFKDDPTAQLVAKTPDYLLLIGDDWCWAEIKNTTAYQRSEYDYHVTLTNAGQTVLLFVPDNEDLVGFNVNKLKFNPADNVFRIRNKAIPSDGPWLMPSRTNESWTRADYLHWKSMLGGSGNDHAKIDVEASKLDGKAMRLPGAMKSNGGLLCY